MVIEYIAQTGDLQIKIEDHRHVISPEKTTEDGETIPASDYSNEPQIIQDLASALWSIPETRESTPHRKIVFNTTNCLIVVDGRKITPDTDISNETQEVQAFVNTIYNYTVTLNGKQVQKYKRLYEIKQELEEQ